MPNKFSKKRMLFIWLGLVFAIILVSQSMMRKNEHSLQVGTNSSKAPESALYQCSMHPQITSHEPGNCPICHMELQKVEMDEAKTGASGTKEKKLLFYRHPMNPDVTSKVPAKDEMGMDYVPVYEDDVDESASSATANGRAAFSLSQERQQLIGVTTSTVTYENLQFEVRANGKVAFDPELFTVIEEYRQALITKKEMGANPYESLREQSEELLESSKTKLKLLGLTDQQIKKLGSSKNAPMNLLLPKGNAWIYAEVFEYEAPSIQIGQSIEASVPSFPGKTFVGKVTSISPVLSSETRTLRIRGLVPDPEGLLRPDTFMNVKIKVDLGKKLTVPIEAVLHSGEEDFVFIALEKGRFEPRSVKVGAKAQKKYEIVSGLKEGELVVSSANFLIDSESRLRSALKRMKSSPEILPSNEQKTAPEKSEAPK